MPPSNLRIVVLLILSSLSSLPLGAAETPPAKPAPAAGPSDQQPAPDVPLRRNILLNQVAYLPRAAKRFVVEGLEADAPGTFSLVNVDLQGKWAGFSWKLDAVTDIARPGKQHAFIWAQALAARLFRPSDAGYAEVCLDRARRCFRWLTDKSPGGGTSGTSSSQDSPKTYYDLGTGISAGLQLFLASNEPEYRQYALAMAEKFLALQERDYGGGQQEVRGFFYADVDRREGAMIDVVNPLSPIALCELVESLPEHPQADRWREAIKLFTRDYAGVMAGRNAFGLVPRGIRLADPREPNRFGTGGVPRSRKLGQLGYRYFPGSSGGGRTCHHAGLAVALFKAAKILKQPEWAALAQRQLDWVLGANPFGVSYMVGVGHLNPPEYIYTGFQPRTPRILGATMEGVFGDRDDRPDTLPGHFVTAEYWTVHASFLIWGLAEAKAYEGSVH